MSNRFVKPNINWAELAKRVPPDQKGKFLNFKTKSDGYLRRVMANPPEPPKIDWAAYQKLVPVSGLVDSFKKSYEGLKIPYPQDTLSSKVDEQWKTLEGEIKKFCSESQKNIDETQKELSTLNAMPPFETMTMEMFCELYPDQAPDFVNRPTYWPHNKEEQLDYDEEAPPKPEDDH